MEDGPQELPRLLSADELATVLGVTHYWVVRRAQSGELPAYRVAGRWRFDPGQVGHWLSRQGNVATYDARAPRRVFPTAEREVAPARVNVDTALPVADVAEALQVPVDAVRRWVKGRMLPGVVEGHLAVVDLDAMEQLQAIVAAAAHIASLPPGRTRTQAIGEAIERRLLNHPYGITVGSAKRLGIRIPTWQEVLPSGRR